MAESDPKIAPQDWFAVRKRNARAGLRKLVAIVAENRTDRAEAPLPLHKSIYMSEARNAAEMEHIFRGEPIVVGLSGDIPKTGDTLVFDSVGPSILVTRGKDGVARAFLNMCTHRGAKLVEPPGECRSNHELLRGLAPRLGATHRAYAMTDLEIVDETLRASGWPDAATASRPYCQTTFAPVRLPLGSVSPWACITLTVKPSRLGDV